MITLSHPTGNANVRAILRALDQQGMLEAYYTTLAFEPGSPWVRLAPDCLGKELLRRSFGLPREKVRRRPVREGVRQLARRFGLESLSRHEIGWASVDQVYHDLDRHVAAEIRRGKVGRAIYAYEDGALESFKAAKQAGLACWYDQPIAFWETSARLLKEEAERYPAWAQTLDTEQDSPAKNARKCEEIALADAVFCPSRFVYNSLPAEIRQKPCLVAEFGVPATPPLAPEAAFELPERPRSGPFRVIFAGTLTQRKGLADVFAAMRLLERDYDVELVVIGALAAPLEFYRQEYPRFRYEAPRPYGEMLALMRSCDVLVLPSIVEGRALVQQDAMSCGLPVIVTVNAGGEDLLEDGKTGVMVPIRSPEAIAGAIAHLVEHREQAALMGARARLRAETLTTYGYAEQVVGQMRQIGGFR